MPDDIQKKTTVKLLKKGKINFDGGNSEYEVKELYYWLEYIYYQYRKQILVEIASIKNEYDENAINSIDPSNFIYSEGELSDEEFKADTTIDDKDQIGDTNIDDKDQIGDMIMDSLRN